MIFTKHIMMVLTVTTLALSSPLARRSTGETVIGDLSNVSRDFSAIENAMQLFNGSSASAAHVPVAVTSLEGHLQATANDTAHSPMFSPSESVTITNAWDELKSAYSDSLEGAIRKKAQFQKLGMANAMVNNFNVVRADTNKVSNELKNKVGLLDIPVITLTTSQMDGALQAAIEAYASKN
ncbi:hypothetical protein DTO169C6_4228 [Paecilomyces variotii]|nr:hypothetical protein DTO169C6_4228 [Paecilomyces variotii]